MRLVRFGGAMSLDGYIAGPNGEYDWIVMDPEIDFTGLMKQFDRDFWEAANCSAACWLLVG